MTITRLRPSFTFTEERLADLRAAVPEAFADGRVNWEALKEALGEWTEPEGESAEHFGLFWPGKREARRLAAKPSRGTLVPAPGEGVDEETTRNLFIEGDNLEVLKILQKSYAGRVKMIYIDPPYNTGNDFVYKDNFRDPLGDYLRRTGQVDEAGEAITTNTRADGRFHSNWLSMIYPRLLLARQLMRPDGLIYVSIDDTEVHNLRSVMSEVFGEENFMALLTWRGMHTVRNSSKDFNKNSEFIVCFCKDKDATFTSEQDSWLRLPTDKSDSYPHDDGDGKGKYKYDPLHARNYNKPYTYTFKNGIVWSAPSGRYPAYSPATLKRMEDDGEIAFGSGAPMMKRYLARVQEGVPPDTLLPTEHCGFSKDGSAELFDLFGEKVFDQPKPTMLLKHLLRLSRKVDRSAGSDDIVLDFFAGSGSTAHAVMQLNAEDGGRRRHISIQIPEPLEDKAYATIAEITKERIRRAGKRVREANPEAAGDVGFRVLQLEPSTFRGWEDFDGDDIEQLEALFEEAETPLVKGWTPDALFSEVLLLQGFPLDARIEAQTSFKKNDVRLVTSDHVGHRLWICLDRKLHETTIAALAPATEDVVVCLDAALDDEAKLRLADRCTLETI